MCEYHRDIICGFLDISHTTSFTVKRNKTNRHVENHTLFKGNTDYKWSFSIAILTYCNQMVRGEQLGE